MLRMYLEEKEADRLVNNMRNRKTPTVFCFYGVGNNGKTTVAKHFSSLLDDVSFYDFVDIVPKKTQKYIIFTVNTEEDVEKTRLWAKKYGYLFDDPYEFSRTFP